MSGSPAQFGTGEDPGPVQNGLQDSEDLDDELDASHLDRFMRDRRRARSLPVLLDRDSGRKRVQFADSLGLTLTSIKHFSAQEDPQIPSKVLTRHQSFPPQQQQDLDLGSGLDPDRLVACFPELRDSDLRVQDLRVCLDKVLITQLQVRGQVRVLKGLQVREVGVRYTFNNWRSHVDAHALPVPGEEAAGSDPGDRFWFTVHTPPLMDPGSSVDFAVFVRSDQGEFWDNNQGQNYSIRYRSRSVPVQNLSDAFSAT